MLKIMFFLLSFLSIIGVQGREIHWDWSKIDVTHIQFPKHFLWGCADSALQTEGVETVHGQYVENSWTDYEKSAQLPFPVGKACERWTRYKEDIALLKSIGMNAYRFSIDWSKIEPREGQFEYQALEHYISEVDELLAQGITPMLTLFHHVCPSWFMQKGGFEFAENNKYFVRFAQYVFAKLHKKVQYWIIFNEPIAYAFEGYFRGHYPPNKNSLRLAGYVILNQLNAHVEIAQAFKKIDQSAQIGMAHMCHPIDAFSRFNPFEQMLTKFFSYLMNETAIQFFKTGKFRWVQPWVLGKNPLAPQSIDFIGVNYYTHTTIKQVHPFKMEARVRPEEKLVDVTLGNEERAKVMYPEGLYRSIKRVAQLGIPIYITENGAATEDPALKEEYLKKHLYVISRAIEEGFDVRGYFYWALTDCFSWNKGYKNRHGIFAVDFQTQERTYRSFTQYLLDVIARFK